MDNLSFYPTLSDDLLENLVSSVESMSSAISLKETTDTLDPGEKQR